MFKYIDGNLKNDNSSHAQIFKRIFDNENVLELGCATGGLAKELRSERGARVCGVEIDPDAMKTAEQYLELGIVADIDSDPWAEKFEGRLFDVVICADVLEHLRRPEAAIKTADSLLTEKGRIVFSLPNIAHGDIISKLLNGRFDYTPTGLLDNTHIYFFAKNNIAEFFDRCGFTLTELCAVRLPIGSTEQACPDMNPNIISFIDTAPDADIYQFVGVAYKKAYAKEAGLLLADDTASSKEGLVYFDIGQGFSEQNAAKITSSNGLFDEEIDLPEGIRSMRFDPSVSSGFIYTEAEFYEDGNKTSPSNISNMMCINDTYIADGQDPQFIFNLKEGAKKFSLKLKRNFILDFESGADFIFDVYKDLEVSFDTIKRKTESQAETINAITAEKRQLDTEKRQLERNCSLLSEALDQKEAELANLRDHYNMAIEHRNLLQARATELEAMYCTISGSASWKMTKPLRVVLDFLKKIFRKVPPIRLAYKALKCLKNNGFKYTFRKIKDKFRHNKAAKAAVLTPAQIERQRAAVFDKNIKFSVLVPLYNTPEKLLKEMIESVINQTYSNWELCLADGSNEEHGYVEEVVKSYSEKDPRVKYLRLEKNLGISENTNNCEKMATGDFIALLDHDDLITPDALYENANAICQTNADVLYSDEDHLSISGLHVNPFYKPDFSPDLLRSQMYICHFLVIKRSLFEEIGGFNSEFDGSQDYDLMLRLTEKTDKICHIPKVLYNWRECEGSTAANADAKPYAHTAGKNALDAHLKRVFGDGAYAAESDYTFVFDARFDTMKNDPLVSVIIPMKDKSDLSDACIRSIIEKSTYQNYEIIVLDNRSSEPSTFKWFEQIEAFDQRVKVHKADMEFNWSKINNHGIKLAKGEVYIFLNNDIEIITPDWIERLCENALRDDIGVVGPLLLYEDNTIQHAGVVVGFSGWADHVFKGMPPVHYGAPYVSPMVSRNALAVTGACLAVSKATIDTIGGFDETFIICGSDIELGIRAYEYGLNNKYLATVRLYHYESKSRDSFIPEQDFKRSYECYGPYRENIDPYYNINLNIHSVIPQESVADMSKMNFRNFLKRCPLTAPICRAIKRAVMPPAECEIPEILEISPRKDTKDGGKLRINLLTPSVDTKHVFGGISTAIKMFEGLRAELGCEARLITTDAPVIAESSVASKDYKIVDCDDDSDAPLQLVSFSSRYGKTIPVREQDIFVATGWWTAYTIKDVILWQSEEFKKAALPLVYMIQDYEPGFYPWSSRYMMADSTYKLKTPIFAMINSRLLREFLDMGGYSFAKAWDFEPVLNDSLKAFLPETAEIEKRKQILVYGRPGTERNAFALLVTGLKKWVEQYPEAAEWEVLSAGETHGDVDLGCGVFLRSCGKLTLEQYATTMLDTYAGVSLMVSPHPSYPPLEMSTFGVKTITNTYSNKDLSSFNENIISLASCSADDIGAALTEICKSYDGRGKVINTTAYAKGGSPFGDCIEKLADAIREAVKDEK